MLTAAGIHVGAHAVGDRGIIDFVVDTFAEALKAHPTKGLRHSIIHANVPTDRAMHLMASLQKTYDAGYPEAQAPSSGGSATPTRGTSDRRKPAPGTVRVLREERRHLGRRVGLQRHALSRAIRPVGLGGARNASRHLREDTIRLGGVDRHRTALKSYTIWAAHLMFLESQVGSLEVGKQADIAVWIATAYRSPRRSSRTCGAR